MYRSNGVPVNFFQVDTAVPSTILATEVIFIEVLKRKSMCEDNLNMEGDITGYLNELNLKLQGKDHLVSDLVGHINGFRSKLNLFTTALEENDFSCCRQLTEEFENDEALGFSEFSINIQNIMAEFNIRFQDFEGMKSSILIFNNPLGVVIQEQSANLQLELCDLQADAFLQTKTEKGPAFFKLISSHRFPHLCDFRRKMSSMCVFSAMKFIKNQYRSSLTIFLCCIFCSWPQQGLMWTFLL
ncbi:hypothetical protein PR048_021306 [Dryococelus australis]|uniref:Uncharacterized protein n=1 Tax=Dryococelus australis TaxID=614101 RepID=A0ABQ9GXU6_9NEOP|nr:hypothetical protein PR048_021306 [Dryococelus australis]